MNRDRPTMRDVARHAGVSLKTVSRVVNDEAGVHPSTTDRVIAAIRELGFRRNDLARSLRQGTTSATIGLVIGDMANPFYSSIARAVEEHARRKGTLLITGSSEEDPDSERELVGTLLTRRVDGVLIVPAGRDHSWLAEEVRRGLPAVFLDRTAEGVDCDTVVFDNVGGARTAVQHLLLAGYRRIAIVGDTSTLYTAQGRLAGYRAALHEAGLTVDDTLVRLGAHDTARAEQAMTDLLALPNPPDAVFSANNRITVGVLHALRATGRDLGLVGFDDFELADLLGVTVVAGDPAEMGRQAAGCLFTRLAGDTRPPREFVVSPVLVARGSGERRVEATA